MRTVVQEMINLRPRPAILRRFEWLEGERNFLPGPPRLSLGERKSLEGRPMRQLSLWSRRWDGVLRRRTQERFGCLRSVQAREAASC